MRSFAEAVRIRGRPRPQVRRRATPCCLGARASPLDLALLEVAGSGLVLGLPSFLAAAQLLGVAL